MTSTTYQQILAEGKAEGKVVERVRLLDTLLRARLRERAQPLLSRLEGCSAETATRVTELVGSRALGDNELITALESLLAGGPPDR